MVSILPIQEKVVSTIQRISGKEITDFNSNLFGGDIDVNGREMAYIFLELEKIFEVDLNKVIDHFHPYTINGLVEGIRSVREAGN